MMETIFSILASIVPVVIKLFVQKKEAQDKALAAFQGWVNERLDWAKKPEKLKDYYDKQKDHFMPDQKLDSEKQDLSSKKIQPEAWVQWAKGELGTEEIKGKEHNQRILTYGKSVTSIAYKEDETPWCSVFVNWVFDQVGIEPTRSALARSWLQWGIDCGSYKYGAVCIMQRGNKSWQGHVGFAVDHKNDKVLILGGNQSDKVSLQWYSLKDVLGFRMPKV